MHVVPPEEFGAGGVRDFFPEGVPDLFAVDDVIGLFPKADFGGLTVVPAVGDDAVLLRRGCR